MKISAPVGSILADQFLAGELIAKGHDLELPVVANHHVSDEEVGELDLRVLDLLQEDLLVFYIVLLRTKCTISICWAGTK
jgi:hypothetical protein